MPSTKSQVRKGVIEVLVDRTDHDAVTEDMNLGSPGLGLSTKRIRALSPYLTKKFTSEKLLLSQNEIGDQKPSLVSDLVDIVYNRLRKVTRSLISAGVIEVIEENVAGNPSVTENTNLREGGLNLKRGDRYALASPTKRKLRKYMRFKLSGSVTAKTHKAREIVDHIMNQIPQNRK